MAEESNQHNSSTQNTTSTNSQQEQPEENQEEAAPPPKAQTEAAAEQPTVSEGDASPTADDTETDAITAGVDKVSVTEGTGGGGSQPRNHDGSDDERGNGGDDGVFSGWGFGSAVNSNMTSISSLLSSTGGQLLNAPTSFFSSADTATTTTTTTETETETTDIEATGKKEIEDEDLGKAASHLASAAGAELEIASKAAQETIGKAAQEIGRGWGTLNSFLDDMLAPDTANGASSGHNGSSQRSGGGSGASGSISEIAAELGASSSATDIQSVFRELFPRVQKEGEEIEEEDQEQVVDHYGCTLIQKYRCYLNNSTPEKAFALRGRLFVTMSNISMYVADDAGAFGGNAFGINIPFESVVKIQKGAKAMLRVVTRAQTSFIFAEFQSETHFQGALSLLEQLGAPSSVAPPVPGPAPESSTPPESSPSK